MLDENPNFPCRDAARLALELLRLADMLAVPLKRLAIIQFQP